MQIASIPPPLMTPALPQEVVGKAVPMLQATAPLVANAINPPPKSEKSNQSRDEEERAPKRNPKHTQEQNPDADDDRGNNVNLSV